MDDGNWEPDPHQIQISCKGNQSINFDSLIVSIYPIYGTKSKSLSLIMNREINAYFNNSIIINNRVDSSLPTLLRCKTSVPTSSKFYTNYLQSINYYPSRYNYDIIRTVSWKIMTCSEKRDHLGYFIKFLAWIDSFLCAESNGASFMKKYQSQVEL